MDSRLASRNEIAKITWRNLAMGQLIDLRAVPLDVLLSVRKDDREHLLERAVKGSLLFTLDQTEKCHWTTPAALCGSSTGSISGGLAYGSSVASGGGGSAHCKQRYDNDDQATHGKNDTA